MITIIVLIILAAVTILTVTNHNIIGKAGKGAEDYAKGQEYELGEINNVTKILGDFENKIIGNGEKDENTNIVKFTLDGVEFSCEKGTTWYDFALEHEEMTYGYVQNDVGFSLVWYDATSYDGNAQPMNGYFVLYNDEYVFSDDEIKDGQYVRGSENCSIYENQIW